MNIDLIEELKMEYTLPDAVRAIQTLRNDIVRLINENAALKTGHWEPVGRDSFVMCKCGYEDCRKHLHTVGETNLTISHGGVLDKGITIVLGDKHRLCKWVAS